MAARSAPTLSDMDLAKFLRDMDERIRRLENRPTQNGPEGPAGVDGAAGAAGADVGWFVVAVGDGVLWDYPVVHNLGSQDVVVSVRRSATPWDEVFVLNEATNVNTVTVRFPNPPFTSPPGVGEFRVTVLGPPA